MLSRFLAHLESSQIIKRGQRVLVGYSGGPDSTALLHLLHVAGCDVVGGHLHHGQRQEADREMALCRAFCEELGVPFLCGRADVPSLANDFRIGLEEAGRLARYDFFNSACAELNCDVVATAHTKDDHVETVLLHLARGTGLAGLAGIPERRENIVRPFLPFTRKETREYCEESGLWTHDDPANTDLRFSRARIRAHVIPELEEINAAFAESIERFAVIAREEDELLNGMAAAALERSEVHVNGALSFLTEGAELAFDRAILLHLPPPILKRALRLAALALGGAMDYAGTLAAAEGVRAGGAGSITTEGGIAILSWTDSRVWARLAAADSPFRSNLVCPGEVISDEFNWALSARNAPNHAYQAERASLECRIDVARVKGNIYFRNWKQSDKIQPLGFEGHRKVSDLLSETGLTALARRRLPIVCDLIGPIWIPGVCLNERVKVERGGAEAIELKLRPASSPLL